MKKNRKQEKVQRASNNTVQKKTGFKMLNNWVFVEAAVKDMQYVRTGTQV